MKAAIGFHQSQGDVELLDQHGEAIEPAGEPPLGVTTLRDVVCQNLLDHYAAREQAGIAAIIAEVRPGLLKFLDVGYRPGVAGWSTAKREEWVVATATVKESRRIAAWRQECHAAVIRELPAALNAVLAKFATLPLIPNANGSFTLHADVSVPGAGTGRRDVTP